MYKKYAVTSKGFCMNRGDIPVGQQQTYDSTDLLSQPIITSVANLYLFSAAIVFKYASKSKFLSSGSRMTIRIELALLKLMRGATIPLLKARKLHFEDEGSSGRMLGRVNVLSPPWVF